MASDACGPSRLWDAERRQVVGRFPGETSCLSRCWSVLELVIAGARSLGLSDFEHQQLAQMRAARLAQSSMEMSA